MHYCLVMSTIWLHASIHSPPFPHPSSLAQARLIAYTCLKHTPLFHIPFELPYPLGLEMLSTAPQCQPGCTIWCDLLLWYCLNSQRYVHLHRLNNDYFPQFIYVKGNSKEIRRLILMRLSLLTHCFNRRMKRYVVSCRLITSTERRGEGRGGGK